MQSTMQTTMRATLNHNGGNSINAIQCPLKEWLLGYLITGKVWNYCLTEDITVDNFSAQQANKND